MHSRNTCDQFFPASPGSRTHDLVVWAKKCFSLITKSDGSFKCWHDAYWFYCVWKSKCTSNCSCQFAVLLFSRQLWPITMRPSVYRPRWPGSLISCRCGSRSSVWWERLLSRSPFPSFSSAPYEDTDSPPSTCRWASMHVFDLKLRSSHEFVHQCNILVVYSFCFRCWSSCLGIITSLIFSPSPCACRCWMTNTWTSGSEDPRQRPRAVWTHLRYSKMFLKEVYSAHQGCMYLFKNTVKTVILWNI